ncbi:PREDICTED: uncharacterized protein C1orf65 homolog [Chrysochloris asiatica]|uniref:Uncharacterized protein C1orf65 homolog n=1 Tax=Chrysochloris asiatica TaxID=185453 RepID=A0A9B0TVM6_CHRAS|nr:PREDICTED: uncharacterized protein C1orf65 homolog [Chrysochloris asiatica]
MGICLKLHGSKFSESTVCAGGDSGPRNRRAGRVTTAPPGGPETLTQTLGMPRGSMVGLDGFSSRPYLDLWESPLPTPELASSAWRSRPGARPAPALCAWAGDPAPGSEAALHWQALPPRYSPTPRPLRHEYNYPSWESRSLTDVALRPPDRARKQRSCSRRLENAWGEAGTKPQQLRGCSHSRIWQPMQLYQTQPCQHYPPAQGDSPPPSPSRAYTPLSEPFGVEKVQNGNQWAVPVGRDLGCWSLSSAPTEKSSVLSKVSAQSASVYPQGSNELMESLASQYSQLEGSSEPVSSEEVQGQQTQLLKSKLAEMVISSRDQKIVALVLARLQKAQRMRELQQQAVAAWEELKLSDQKVQMTLERERQLLLQQNQEQWQQEKEQPNRQVKNKIQKEGPWKRQVEGQEKQRQGKLERSRGAADHRKQWPLQQLKGQQRSQEQKSLQPQKRLEQDCHKRHLHAMGDLKKAQVTNLTSIVNYQARKVLMDCQAKAEELLRKLSLEQNYHQSQETQQCLVKEHHQELREKDQKEHKKFQVKWQAGELKEQTKMHKRMLMELADQKIRQAKSNAHKNIKDKAKRVRDLNVLREKNPHILKLKAEKEEKCHIEGIKEAIKKKQQRMEQISREKAAALEEFQKISRVSLQPRDKMRAFDQMAGEA